MVEHLKNIRKFDFPLDRFDNDPYLKNPLMKLRINTTKRKKQSKRRKKVVSIQYFHSQGFQCT